MAGEKRYVVNLIDAHHLNNIKNIILFTIIKNINILSNYIL